MADEGPAQQKTDTGEEKLPPSWRRVHGAIWLIGLAVLAWQNWWWPGILILVAISGLAETVIRMQISRQQAQADAAREAKDLAITRATALPEVCPRCGSPVNADEVVWTSDVTADCSFCGSSLKAVPDGDAQGSRS